MRHYWTPVFRDLLNSTIQDQAPEVRCVWMALMLSADPEGFVQGTVASLARLANVSEDWVHGALLYFTQPDPLSAKPDEGDDGTRLDVVPRGWRIRSAVSRRELARDESKRARQRVAQARRRSRDVTPSHPGVDATQTETETQTHSSEGVIPPAPPQVEGYAITTGGDIVVTGFTRTYTNLDGMDESGLEDEAVMAGMSRQWYRERLASVKNTTIGGRTGVRNQRDWVRNQFGRWKTWEEDQRAKSRAAQDGNARRGQPEPELPKAPKVPGMPAWVRPEHVEHCREARLPLKALAKAFAKDHHIPPKNLKPADAATAFTEYLRRHAQARTEAA